jgi:hypothetical protein
MGSSLRVYFYDMGLPKGAKELKDHPANGMTFTGTGSMAVDASGEFVKGTHVSIEGRSPRALAAGISFADRGVPGEVSVTLADFPDRVGEIRVKVWGPEYLDWSTLAEDDAEGLRKAVAAAEHRRDVLRRTDPERYAEVWADEADRDDAADRYDLG